MTELNVSICVFDGRLETVVLTNKTKNLTIEKIKYGFYSTYAQTKYDTYHLFVVCTEEMVEKIACKFVEFIKKQVNENDFE